MCAAGRRDLSLGVPIATIGEQAELRGASTFLG